MELKEIFLKLLSEAGSLRWTNKEWATKAEIDQTHISNLKAWAYDREGGMASKWKKNGYTPTRSIVGLAGALGYDVVIHYELKKREVVES